MVSNNSGTGNARVYRRVGALVRAGVPAFLLAKPLRAYTLTHSKMGKLFISQNYLKRLIFIFISKLSVILELSSFIYNYILIDDINDHVPKTVICLFNSLIIQN